jgi:hypothetical protein
LQEQVQTFYALSKKTELSDTEQLQKAVCKRAMADNGILNAADADALCRRAESLEKRIGSMKNGLEKCRQQYAVYKDIRDTYYRISKGDYISNLVEEEHQRQAQVKKNKPRR